ncbi:MAG: tetratricopeptide repeat protein [Gammaproteobacteria bacterium]
MSLDLRHQPFRLDGIRIDPVSGCIGEGDHASQVQPKVMDLLLCLTENHGTIVSKEYLLEHVWQGRFVVDGALRRCVFYLRKALAHAGLDGCIETVPCRGFRLSKVPEAEAQTPAAGPNRALDAYRGLQPFGPEHAALFFGRDAVVRQVLDALSAQRQDGRAFVLILGASGSGKSSLARAGVGPQLQLLEHDAGNENFQMLDFRLSDSLTEPLTYLKTRLESIAPGVLDDTLGSDDDTHEEPTDPNLDPVAEPPRLLLVFDQFEELFLLDSVSETAREEIVELLYALARSGSVAIVATMRSEFLPRFTEHQCLIYLKGQRGHVDLLPPTAPEIADIVRRPAQMAGLVFGEDSGGRKLDHALIDDATGQPEALPLLQFALRELELAATEDRIMPLDAYVHLGGLSGCLSRHAERVFNELSGEGKRALPEVLQRLVIADPRNAGRVLKRTESVAQLESIEGAGELVHSFVRARLFSSFLDPTTRQPSVQVVHEAVLAEWTRARDWVNINYAGIRFRSWLDEVATRWDTSGRTSEYLLRAGTSLDEAQRIASEPNALERTTGEFVVASTHLASRRQRRIRTVIACLVVLSVASLLLWRQAVIGNQRAELAAKRAEATTEFMVSIFESANPDNSNGKNLSAAELLATATERIMRAEWDQSQGRAAIVRALGETNLLIGREQDADRLLGELETLLPGIAPQAPRLAASMALEIGARYRDLDQSDQADLWLQQALDLASGTKDTYLVARCRNALGLLHSRQGDQDRALESYVAADALLEKSVADIATKSLQFNVHANRAMSLMKQGELEQAARWMTSANTLRRLGGQPPKASDADALANFGSVRLKQGQLDEAIELYDEALRIRTDLHGPQHPRNGIYLVNKLSALVRLGRFEDVYEVALSGVDTSASAHSPNPTIVALFNVRLVLAAWLTERQLGVSPLEKAQASMPMLLEIYGDESATIRHSKIALAGYQLSQNLTATMRKENCTTLEQARTKLSKEEEPATSIDLKLTTVFDAGGACYAVP